MVCYSQQITQWFAGSPIIRGHTLLKELQCTLSHLLKGKEQCLILSFLEHILAATAQTCCRGRRGQKAPLPLPWARKGSDYAAQAGWGSLAPRRKQQKARPGRALLFLHTGGEHMLHTFRSRTVSMPQWGPAPPSLPPLPKSLFPHSVLSRDTGSIPEANISSMSV